MTMAHCSRCGDPVPVQSGRQYTRKLSEERSVICESCLDEMADGVRQALKEQQRHLDLMPREDLSDLIR